MTASRDGGLQNLEVHGIMTLRINDESRGRVKLVLQQGDMKNVQLQVRHRKRSAHQRETTVHWSAQPP